MVDKQRMCLSVDVIMSTGRHTHRKSCTQRYIGFPPIKKHDSHWSYDSISHFVPSTQLGNDTPEYIIYIQCTIRPTPGFTLSCSGSGFSIM